MVRDIVQDSWQQMGLLLHNMGVQYVVSKSTWVALPRTFYWSFGQYMQLRWCGKVKSLIC